MMGEEKAGRYYCYRCVDYDNDEEEATRTRTERDYDMWIIVVFVISRNKSMAAVNGDRCFSLFCFSSVQSITTLLPVIKTMDDAGNVYAMKMRKEMVYFC